MASKLKSRNEYIEILATYGIGFNCDDSKEVLARKLYDGLRRRDDYKDKRDLCQSTSHYQNELL